VLLPGEIPPKIVGHTHHPVSEATEDPVQRRRETPESVSMACVYHCRYSREARRHTAPKLGRRIVGVDDSRSQITKEAHEFPEPRHSRAAAAYPVDRVPQPTNLPSRLSNVGESEEVRLDRAGVVEPCKVHEQPFHSPSGEA
jgi:hypothetical protein